MQKKNIEDASKAKQRLTKKNEKLSLNKNDIHPDHSKHIPRLHRVSGQINGIEQMILAGRYCPDIMTQLKAASSALRAIEAEIFKTHLNGCVKFAFKTKNKDDADKKIQEILKIISSV